MISNNRLSIDGIKTINDSLSANNNIKKILVNDKDLDEIGKDMGLKYVNHQQ